MYDILTYILLIIKVNKLKELSNFFVLFQVLLPARYPGEG